MASASLPKLLLDTDPGGDDIFALLWLASLVHQGLAELVAVTTAAGNVSAARTFANASQILSLAALGHIEVGLGVPVVGATEEAAHIHGADGMGGLSSTLPPPSHSKATARRSEEVLIDCLTAAPGEITVVAIGPLTNLAAAELKSPGVLQKAREIVIMGGAFACRGNITARAEFNLWFNPDAAQIVFNSRRDLVVLPVDVTSRLIFTRAMAQGLCAVAPQSLLADFVGQLVEFMISTALTYRETQGLPGFLVHDAVTLAYLFYPELLRFQRGQVQIETRDGGTRGQVWLDERPLAKGTANAWVALEIDPEGVFIRFLEDLKFLLRWAIAP